jgi:rhodanese-related sulfurtransferase
MRTMPWSLNAVRVPLLTLLICAGLSALSACTTPRTSDRDVTMIEPREALDLIEPTRRGARLGRDLRTVVVDPRTEPEYRAERIAGAIHLPLDLAREEHHLLREFHVVIVYGNDFTSPRAIALSKLLMELRHRDVRTIRGGLRAWKEAGYPTESGG